MKNKIITRSAPSPTGNLNMGGVRTTLFNYLFAKQNDGKVILRFEDTDKGRSKTEFETDIIKGLDWLEIKCDEIYRQSDRTSIYKKYIEEMILKGKAYVSEEKEGPRKEVIRFKNPNTVVTFTDSLRGEISIDTTDLGDFVIARSIDDPLYHLTVVVDDKEMDVTHVIRGEDGISNTPRQILIQEAIDAPRPLYTHMPMVLGSDKKKLSKRHGAKSTSEFKEEGYLPEAIINYIAMLGWNPGTDKEIFSIEDLIKEFSLEKIQKGGAVFDIEKLKWFNKHYLQNKDIQEVNTEIKKRLNFYNINISEDMLDKLLPTIIERISVYSDLEIMRDSGEFSYYLEHPDYNADSLIWKKAGREETIEHLEYAYKVFSEATDFSSKENIKKLFWDYAEERGRGNVLWPLRYALSGQEKSPDPFELIYILGKNITIERIAYALKKLQK